MNFAFTPGTKGQKEYHIEPGQFDEELGAHLFQWKNINNLSRLPQGSNYILSFFLEPKFHWKNIIINNSVIDIYPNACAHSEVIKFTEGWINITYRAQKKYDIEYKGNMLEFALLNVSMGIYEYQSFVQSFHAREDHQIFAVLKIEKGHTVVLGRAQSVHTTEYGGTRTYTWMASTDKDKLVFEGVPRRNSMGSHIEDLIVMDNFKQGPLLSARPKRQYEADNDSFSNTNNVLPISVPKDYEGSISIQFFNAKYKPAPFVESSVRWASIFSNCQPPYKSGLFNRRKSTSNPQLKYVHNEILSDYLSFKLLFTYNDCGISMIELIFVAHEYHFSLESMGKNIKLNSI